MNSTSFLSFGRKVGRVMVITVSIVAAGIIVLVGALWLASPGKMEPFVDEQGQPLPGSISEKVFVDINGTRQGMFIQGKDASNPVLLILHGGMPEFFLTETYPTGLEDAFTLVWWEQRGSGISYNARQAGEPITVEQMIADTVAVTDYLRDRFGQDKIYLMGHSGGSFIGIQAVARFPERYRAYIGQAQMSNQLLSEKMVYDYMVQRSKAEGNEDLSRKLQAAPVTLEGGTPPAYRAMRDEAMHGLGIGTTRDMNSVVTGIFLPSWRSPAYTLTEKTNLWRGKAQAGIAILWDTMIHTDLSQQVTELQIPVYFFSGTYDYTCNYHLSRAYFDKIHAPVKGFYTFADSAHSPIFEEPERVRQILLEDVQTGTNQLADAY